MKKLYIILIIFFSIFNYGLATDSPIDKGSFLISGGFSFNNLGGELYEDIYGNRLTSISAVTSLNYFFIPHFAFGINFEIGYASQGTISSTMLGVGPQAFLYLGSTESQLSFRHSVYPFINASFYYLRETLIVGGISSTADGTMILFGGGLTYMVTNTVGLSTKLFYHIDHIKFEDDTVFTGNGFNIWMSFDIFIY